MAMLPIGVAEEYAIGHYFRRCMVIEHTFGDTAWHSARFAAQREQVGPEGTPGGEARGITANGAAPMDRLGRLRPAARIDPGRFVVSALSAAA